MTTCSVVLRRTSAAAALFPHPEDGLRKARYDAAVQGSSARSTAPRQSLTLANSASTVGASSWWTELAISVTDPPGARQRWHGEQPSSLGNHRVQGYCTVTVPIMDGWMLQI